MRFGPNRTLRAESAVEAVFFDRVQQCNATEMLVFVVDREPMVIASFEYGTGNSPFFLKLRHKPGALVCIHIFIDFDFDLLSLRRGDLGTGEGGTLGAGAAGRRIR